MVQLPVGCEYDGQAEVDVGQCLKQGCRGPELDTGQCDDALTSCCGVTSYDTLYIECSDGSLVSYDLVTNCGCLANCTVV